jgi:hypothetical protein
MATRDRYPNDPEGAKIAATQDRHAAIFLMLLTLIDRVGNDGGIKDRLHYLAEVEREKAEQEAARNAPDAESVS